ncbi:hypothetical protein DPEC_G00145400 [Dallia pectoralis]|uniref:Uncharacterized protein n=1 Tax=Dallia pectoralis TaxID=75939 RepID=A0ACC2GPF0_DALPE|nr:hypothetical protein DPEC_G00145400 [Dallia pectoralis]
MKGSLLNYQVLVGRPRTCSCRTPFPRLVCSRATSIIFPSHSLLSIMPPERTCRHSAYITDSRLPLRPRRTPVPFRKAPQLAPK